VGDRREPTAKIIHALAEDAGGDEKMVAQIAESMEEELCREVLKVLTHLDFEPKEAQSHWMSIWKHKVLMSKKLGRKIGLRVAMLDYFSRINRKIKSPKIIELDFFDKLAASVVTDELTQLYNKRFFKEVLHREVERARRYNLDLSLLMVDLDDFKKCNDCFGHLFGDKVLAGLAEILRDNLREVDFACRYGGEEFAIVLPETSGQATLAAAERLRGRIEKTKFYAEVAERDFSITISGGVSSLGPEVETAEELTRKADVALYRAKSDGKNRIYLYYKEKRRFVRVNAKCDVSYRILSEEERRNSATTNIGGGGLLFECREVIPKGSAVELSIHVPGVDHPIDALGRVVRVRSRGDGNFDIGLFFNKIDPLDQTSIIKYASKTGPRARPATSRYLL